MPHKRSVRKEINRIEHKQARAAERQALEGGHARVVHGMGWGSNIPQPSLLDEESRRYPSRRKGCKKNRAGNGKHEPVYRSASQLARVTMQIGHRRYLYGSTFVCKHCGKSMWGVKPPPGTSTGKSGEHWTMDHIMERLAGGQDACTCKGCNPS